jgi:hypothetical protein
MGDGMRVTIHTAVPDSKRTVAATMDGLSGRPDEHSIECTATPGGPSATWDAANSYNGKWWAASQALAPQIAGGMLQSGYMLGTESWFVAYYEGTSTIVPNGTNIDPPPANASFDAFLTAIGVTKVQTGGPS